MTTLGRITPSNAPYRSSQAENVQPSAEVKEITAEDLDAFGPQSYPKLAVVLGIFEGAALPTTPDAAEDWLQRTIKSARGMIDRTDPKVAGADSPLTLFNLVTQANTQNIQAGDLLLAWRDKEAAVTSLDNMQATLRAQEVYAASILGVKSFSIRDLFAGKKRPEGTPNISGFRIPLDAVHERVDSLRNTLNERWETMAGAKGAFAKSLALAAQMPEVQSLVGNRRDQAILLRAMAMTAIGDGRMNDDLKTLARTVVSYPQNAHLHNDKPVGGDPWLNAGLDR